MEQSVTYLEMLLNQVKFGSQDSDKHLLTLWALVLQINAQRILELGVRNGNTTLPFLLGVTEVYGHVHSVDLEPTTFSCPEGLQPSWTFYQSDAIAWLENRRAEGGQYDIIYVDDWHSYPHVRQELEIITDLITPSGLVILHDLMYSDAQPHYRSDRNAADPQWAEGGPYRAVAELDTNVWEWMTIPVNHGLTLLRKKTGQIIGS